MEYTDKMEEYNTYLNYFLFGVDSRRRCWDRRVHMNCIFAYTIQQKKKKNPAHCDLKWVSLSLSHSLSIYVILTAFILPYIRSASEPNNQPNNQSSNEMGFFMVKMCGMPNRKWAQSKYFIAFAYNVCTVNGNKLKWLMRNRFDVCT